MANAWREAEQSWDVRNTLWTPRKRNQIEWLINFYDDTRKIDIYSKQKKKKKGKNGARVMELPCIQLLRRGDSQQKNVQVFTQLRGRMRTDLMVATSRRAGTRINSISVLLWLMPSHPLAGGLSGCHVTHIHRKDSSQLLLFFARLLGMTFFFLLSFIKKRLFCPHLSASLLSLNRHVPRIYLWAIILHLIWRVCLWRGICWMGE